MAAVRRTRPHIGGREKCPLCGRTFIVKAAHALRCDECGIAFEREWSKFRMRYRRRGVANGAELAAKDAEASVRKAVAEGRLSELARPPAGSRQPPEQPHKCPFCGKNATNGTYCSRCEETGLANVHRVTGRTNGWDRPRHPPIKKPVHGWW